MFISHADDSRGVEVLAAFVCFSVQYLKNRCSYDHQTWLENALR